MKMTMFWQAIVDESVRDSSRDFRPEIIKVREVRNFGEIRWKHSKPCQLVLSTTGL